MRMIINSTNYWDCESFKSYYKELFEKFKIEEKGNGCDTVFIIEIDSLDDLLRLEEECGREIIICKSYSVKDMYVIEIYDGWRE